MRLQAALPHTVPAGSSCGMLVAATCNVKFEAHAYLSTDARTFWPVQQAWQCLRDGLRLKKETKDNSNFRPFMTCVCVTASKALWCAC
jgi:hypothetical protein